jgi:hypothetical protein
MFDLVQGLPVHALVVHAVVVLLPLAAVGTLAVTSVPRWRPQLRWWVGADVAMLVASFVAKESGEKLQSRLSQAAGHQVAEDHAEMGDLVPVIALVLLVAAAVAYWLIGRLPADAPVASGRRGIAVALVAVVAVATIGWTVAVGHSGADSVWREEIASTSAPAGD